LINQNTLRSRLLILML